MLICSFSPSWDLKTYLNMRGLTLECKISVWPMFRMWDLVLAVLCLYAYGSLSRVSCIWEALGAVPGKEVSSRAHDS